MRTKSPTLHGSAPDSSPVSLLIVDMLSSFDFSEGSRVLEEATRTAAAIAQLKARITAVGIPTIYINDNVGRWQSAGQRVIDQNAAPTHRGRHIRDLLLPTNADYLVLKPKHSGFYATPLSVLLEHLNTTALILTGMTATQCILFTAIDAYVRDFHLYIPEDCVVYGNQADRRAALHLFADTLGADTRPSVDLRIPALRRRHTMRRPR